MVGRERQHLDIEVGGIAKDGADALCLCVHIYFLDFARLCLCVFCERGGERGPAGLLGGGGEGWGHVAFRYETHLLCLFFFFSLRILPHPAFGASVHRPLRRRPPFPSPSSSSASMDLFHAKIVAAATGSTMTALTSTLSAPLPAPLTLPLQ